MKWALSKIGVLTVLMVVAAVAPASAARPAGGQFSRSGSGSAVQPRSSFAPNRPGVGLNTGQGGSNMGQANTLAAPNRPGVGLNTGSSTAQPLMAAPNRPGVDLNAGQGGWNSGQANWGTPAGYSQGYATDTSSNPSGYSYSTGYPSSTPGVPRSLPLVPTSTPPPNPPSSATTTAAIPIQIPETKPLPNDLQLHARTITAAEIQAAGRFFSSEFQRAVGDLESQVADSGVDSSSLVSELNGRSVAEDAQLQILDAVKEGNGARAQVLWTGATKDIGRAARLSKQVGLQSALAKLRDKAGRGDLGIQDIRSARHAILAAADPDKARTAGDALDQLETQVKIRDAVSAAVPGQGKSAPIALAGAAPVIWNPKLPAHSAVALGDGYLMVGTGGVGTLDMTTTDIAQALGLPRGTGDPAPASSVPQFIEGVVLLNPAAPQTPVYFKVDGQDFSLAPDHGRHVPGNATRTIDFDRGAAFGRKTYSLAPGTYQFTPTDSGWDLQSVTFTATIDNSDSAREFHYVVQNEQVVVPPGQVRTHNSAYPIVVRFDRGNGVAIKQVRIAQATLKVGVNSADNQWDLFLPATNQTAAKGFVPAF